MAKRSKEERQAEFVDMTQQLIGFHIADWQKSWLNEALSRFAAGQPVDMCTCRPVKVPGRVTPTRHSPGCPQKDK